ncbi:MAG TPA: NADH-quinone oxidoreductase subunit H [Anaerolineaceae bacterium]|nr:NADH-quinone oxidoreductase subunit H [Anaerolineaceae bacterium]HQH84138.1 NADH-quinone oxidoreductase subunit H [Anaerolineaceae bacterium]
MELSLHPIILLLFFPGGLFLFVAGLLYEWVDRKLVAQYQNRIGPRFIQPLADIIKLLAKEEIVPDGVHKGLFIALPIVGLASALAAALYVPLVGFNPAYSFKGDLIVVVYLLSVMTLCLGLAGANTADRFSLIGATRTLTQLFSYEAPFMLSLLGPAIVAGTWQISEINAFAIQSRPWWFAFTQIVGFLVAMIGLMGKLEMPPFDAPEAETEIVAGALTEYSGRGLALFRIGKDVELVIGLTLIAAFFMGGLANPLDFLWKTAILILVVAALQSLFARLRIDQTVGLWWRAGALLALLQLLAIILGRYLQPVLSQFFSGLFGG